MAVSSVVIFITAKNASEAKKISHQLLQKKLVACVNIIPGVQSFFWWKGKIDSAKEVLLVVKTMKSKIRDVIKYTKNVHSYDVPEVIALPILDGNKDYLNWISESVR